MSSRRPPRFTRLTPALAVALLAAGLSLVSPAAAVDSADLNARGFAQLGSCLSSGDRVEALYVMDVSGSLKETDPSGQRFKALEASVSQLSALVDSSSPGLKVEAALATFGDSYFPPSEIKDWVVVPPGGAPDVAADFRRAAEDSWKQASAVSQGTNYEAALQGAQSTLLDRGSDVGNCRIMFWFTDGLFDLGKPATTNAVSAQMCSPGGLLDGIRLDQISVIALALFNESVQKQLDEAGAAKRRGELQAMAVGTSPERTCGTDPIAEGDRSGAYLTVESAGALASVFSGAIAQGSGGAPVQAASAEPVVVTVEPGVRKFQTDIVTRNRVEQITVTSPAGGVFTVATDGVAVPADGGTITARAYDELATISVTMPNAGTVGDWKVDAGPAANAMIYLFSGLTLQLASPTSDALVAGTSGTVLVNALTADGLPADIGVYKTAEVQTRVVAGDGSPVDAQYRVTDATSGQIALDLTPPDNAAVLDIHVALLPTLLSGIQLPLVPTNGTVPVSLPAAFPSIEPHDGLYAGTLTGTEPITTTLALQGSPEGPTSVCIAPAVDIKVPERATGVTVTPTGCTDLAAGEQQDVTITIATGQSADGAASALLPITLNSAAADGRVSSAASVPLEVTWDMARPVDQVRRALLLLLLMVASIALPLAALWLSNRALAKFVKGNVRSSRRDVQLTSTGPQVSGGGPLVQPDSLAWSYIDGEKARRFEDPGAGMFALTAIAPFNPFGGPSFRAVAEEGWQIIGADTGGYAHNGRWTHVTPGLGTAYLIAVRDADLLREDPDQAVPAVLVLIARTDNPDDLQILVARAQERFDWQGVVDAMRREAGARVQSSPQHAATTAPAPDSGTTLDDGPYGPVPRPETSTGHTTPSAPPSTDAPRWRTPKAAPNPTPPNPASDFEDPYA